MAMHPTLEPEAWHQMVLTGDALVPAIGDKYLFLPNLGKYESLEYILVDFEYIYFRNFCYTLIKYNRNFLPV